jgi:parallel beta-helix repeat protein
MERNDYGIYMFTDCSENVIQSNLLSQNRNSGLKMIHDCTQNQVLNNTISDNDVVGIFLQEGSGRNSIQGNEISNNELFGVQIQEGAGGNTVVENNVSGSKKGFFTSNDGNLIYNNRIFDNVIPADDIGVNQWYSAYPKGGNFWGDYQGQDLMSGPGQNLSGSDGFGDAPHRIGDNTWDRYPIMGTSIMPLKLTEGKILPLRAQVGGKVTVQATLDSKYGVARVWAHALSIVNLAERSRYIPMEKVDGNTYEGLLQTAILDPGRYEIVLTAKDVKGNEIEESIGELDLLARSGRNINSLLS